MEDYYREKITMIRELDNTLNPLTKCPLHVQVVSNYSILRVFLLYNTYETQSPWNHLLAGNHQSICKIWYLKV